MKSFLAACGIENSFQFAVENQNATESRLRLLYQPFAVIGRDLRADVVLDHVDVSRRHVYLQVVDGRVFWVDLESRTGTRGERESQKFGWLEGGRTFCIGPYVIRRFIGDSKALDNVDRSALPRDTPLVARADAHAMQSEVALEFLNGPSQSMFKPVHRVLSLIGSASGCKFRLTDSSVSRFHGSLLQTSAGLWVVDLLGQKGITVNDVPVRSSRLVDGDIVRIGRYQIRIRFRGRAQALGSGLFDLGRVTFLPKHARQNHAQIEQDSMNWAPAILPAHSGPMDGQGSAFLPIQASSLRSKIDLMPLDPVLPAKSIQSELAESVLAPLVNQFGLMQQQMVDQFQQAMAMMFQMFGTMQRDQMELIREEFEQLRVLTEEIHALKKELVEQTQDQTGAISRERELNLTEPNESAVVNSTAAASPTAAKPPEPKGSFEASSIGQREVPPSTPIVFQAGRQQSSPDTRVVPNQPSLSPAMSSSSEPSGHTGSQSSAQHNNTNARPDSDRAAVLWLHQRMISLQRERESRWQKILKLVPGMSSS
jgi:pSer/pThr/pTyr-binding forkhead associated (FHA) protein